MKDKEQFVRETFEKQEERGEKMLASKLEAVECRIELIQDGESMPRSEIIEILKDANRTVNLLTADREDWYDEYRYRAFQSGGELFVVKGKDEITEIDVRER